MKLVYSSGRAAFRGGARDAFGVPAAVLGAGFVGYGALAAEAGYSVWLAMVATAAIWALPGQLALIELYAAGAAAVVIVPAVMLTAARFLPMTMVLVPLLRDSRWSRPTVYFAAHLVAMTGWAAGMRRCPELPQAQRMPYFLGFALTCWAASITCCVVGYQLAGSFPPLMRLGFVFLAPVYFAVILVGEVRNRVTAVALACGAFSGPLLYLVNAQWSVLLSDLAGGTLAYLIQRRFRNGDA